MAAVIGYHACRRAFAEGLFSHRLAIADWEPSVNKYDWLGDGIYFWENTLRRAQEWARESKEYPAVDACIIEAEIELGRCLDLTATEFLNLLEQTYDSLVDLYKQKGWKLPLNCDLPLGTSGQRLLLRFLDRINERLYPWLTGQPFRPARDRKLRFLDRLVINQFLNSMENGDGEAITFQTVRCPFEEGDPVFPGSMIRRQTHVQIAVRDTTVITLLDYHDV